MSASRLAVLRVYRQLVGEAHKFSNYNYRHYFVRKIRESFHSNQALTDRKAIEAQLQIAEKKLADLKRQVQLANLYAGPKGVVDDSVKKI